MNFNTTNNNNNNSNVPLRFPFRLYEMLEEAEVNGHDNIISWLPCGTMFRIHNQQAFTAFIMPKYCRHSRYKSFLRQLSMYKFQRVTEGPNQGSYKHQSFKRGRPEMCNLINRGEKDAWHEKERKFVALGGDLDTGRASESAIEKSPDVVKEIDELLQDPIKSHNPNGIGAITGDISCCSDMPMMPFNAAAASCMTGSNRQSMSLSSLPKPDFLSVIKMNASEDILDEIINTFGSSSRPSEPTDFNTSISEPLNFTDMMPLAFESL